ncbi:MAG: GGDEF domain-containing protein [Pseudolabrys sp.]|nr:GGDEF domain-containing protein [Pseudolabrys sp.]
MPYRTFPVRNSVYVELVASLYDTLVPMAIMSAGYVLAFGIMGHVNHDLFLTAFAGIGAFSSAWRVLVAMWGRAELMGGAIDDERARALERRFAIAYFQFAVLLGISTTYALIEAPTQSHMLIVGLLVGYGAGAAVAVGLRPQIAVPSMILGITPGIFAISWDLQPISVVTSGLMAALLIGGIYSLFQRYRIASLQIARGFTFEALARQDNLTKLPNRLALREWFDRHVAPAEPQLFAVHFIDLDKFKPVNDVFGHPVGDSLLKAMAGRLRGSLRSGDIAARLGGDEFTVIQRNIGEPEEAESLARRLREAVAAPFSINGHDIRVSASVGYVLCRDPVPDLEEALSLADQALYRAKKTGSGIESDEWPKRVALRLVKG